MSYRTVGDFRAGDTQCVIEYLCAAWPGPGRLPPIWARHLPAVHRWPSTTTVSYVGDAHFPKHSLEYSLNFWSQSKKKTMCRQISASFEGPHCPSGASGAVE